MTMSLRWRRLASKKSNRARSRSDDPSSIIALAKRMRRQWASGDLSGVRVSDATTLDTASRSCRLIWCSRARAWYCTDGLSEASAVCTSLTHRRTTSPLTLMRWMPETRAEAATKQFLSTSACFKCRSICASMVGSVRAMMAPRTRSALPRLRSTLEFMSLVRVAQTMITSSGPGFSSLSTRYRSRRSCWSLCIRSFVTPKKISVVSKGVSFSPCARSHRILVRI
mmetsp:Transcript_21656/g.69952  ORF Transcript_21656/g.69952 Transcript_21656/m.69952 type:complete len:225 (+) Transcript_21656:1799-2473(+)